MEFLRTKSLRRLVAIGCLISGLSIQAQTLFACDLMDAPAKTECCCGEHMKDGCAMGGGCDFAHSGGCCDVTVDVRSQELAATATTAAKRIVGLDAPQPPTAVLIAAEFSTVLPGTTDRPTLYVLPLSWSSGTRTYLLTNRFRI